ncbi:hypothetical protein I9W82_001370 [Candida metapsilosis]|uniref:Zn(2)-C6 fungal-type domain-containing protein n=1 Tax=Candida metapsilosis TaxID=273372 RepID=A0A8H7ZI80_9ASCO|nr:hypothetical protein I9W82_001370 [Candida metapsilosis]
MQTRNRKVLSCDRCRRRKIKCDRSHPCKTCHRLKKDCRYTLALESMDISKAKHRKEASEPVEVTEFPPINSNYAPPAARDGEMRPSSYASLSTPMSSESYRRTSAAHSIPQQPQAATHSDTSETALLRQRVQELENQLRAEQLSKWNRQNSVAATTSPRMSTPSPGQTNFNYSFTNNEPLPLSHRPFPYMLLMRREGGSKLLYNLLARDGKKDGHLLTSSLLLSDLNTAKTSEIKDKARVALGDYYIPRPGEETLNTDELKKKISLNHYGLKFAAPQVDLRDPISCYFSLIPPAWVCKKLLDLYFKELYVYMPILDEQYFRKSLSRVLGPQINDDYINTFPNVNSSDDLATLVIHLIVLRITYLSLWDLNGNSTSPLSQYPVTYDSVRAAETIMKEFDFTCNQSLTVIQAGLVTRFYVIVAPEGRLTGKLAQVKQGTITQLCYAMGLNRDPSCFQDQSPRMQNLRRKIWHFVVRMDTACSAVYGTLLCTDTNTCDCPLPQFSAESANCHDLKTESIVVETFLQSNDLYQMCRKLAEYHLVASDVFPVEQVIRVLDSLEKQLATICGNVKPLFIQHQSDSASIFKIHVHTEAKLLMAYTYYCLHLYYESQHNHLLSSKYFLKTTTVLLQDLGDLNMHIFSSSNLPIHVLTVGRLTEFYLHFSLMIFTGIRLRLKSYMHLKFPNAGNGERDLEHEILYKLENQLMLYTHAQLIKLGELAKKYRYSLMLRGIHMITIKLCDQFQYLCNSNDPQTVREAAIKLPLDVLQKFSQKLEVYQLPKTNEVYDFSDEGLITEMNRQNMWDQLNVIETEETVTSAWVEKTKKFNKFAEEMKLGFNYNLGLDLNASGLNLFSG